MPIALVKNLIPHFIEEQLLAGNQSGCPGGLRYFCGPLRIYKTHRSPPETGQGRCRKAFGYIECHLRTDGRIGVCPRRFYPLILPVMHFLVFFLMEKTAVDAQRVLAIAAELFRLLEKASPKFKEFAIKIKIGASYGEIFWGILGESNKSFYFRGQAVVGCALSQGFAESQQVIVDEFFKNQLGGEENGLTALEEEGFYRVEGSFLNGLPKKALTE